LTAEDYPDGSTFRRIVDEAQLHAAVQRIAEGIARDYPHGYPLVVVALLKGAVVFLADLVRRLTMPLEIELVSARSYSGTQRGPVVAVQDDLSRLGLAGRHVLLLDCVLDSGHTLHSVLRSVLSCEPASVRTCVLLRKQRERAVSIEPEYVGADVPDVFLVGYGLDYKNLWRHLPYVAELPPGLAGE